jgi:AcrR family transcriptional regulator
VPGSTDRRCSVITKGSIGLPLVPKIAKEAMSTNPKSERAQTILDVAEGLVRDEGADGWSLEQLAARAGFDPEAVRQEFESEWAVFCSVIRRDEQRFERVIAVPPGASAGEAVTRLFEACVPDFDWTYWIELWSLSLRDERARKLRLQLDERFRDVVEGMVQAGIESGEFDVTDARVAAITIATLIDAMAVQATLGDTTVRPNYMLDACVTVAGKLLGADLSLGQLEDRLDA